MATTRRRTPAKKASTPARRRRTVTAKPATRRRRRSATMGSAFSKAAMRTGGKMIMQGAAGGAAAKILADNVASQLAGILPGTLAQYSRPITAALGAYLTATTFKNPQIAAGMAGVAGAELAAALVTGTSSPAISDYYDMIDSNPVPGLSGYQVPLADELIYSSNYANNLSGY
jgi:hypothetical protein